MLNRYKGRRAISMLEVGGIWTGDELSQKDMQATPWLSTYWAMDEEDENTSSIEKSNLPGTATGPAEGTVWEGPVIKYRTRSEEPEAEMIKPRRCPAFSLGGATD